MAAFIQVYTVHTSKKYEWNAIRESLSMILEYFCHHIELMVQGQNIDGQNIDSQNVDGQNIDWSKHRLVKTSIGQNIDYK